MYYYWSGGELVSNIQQKNILIPRGKGDQDSQSQGQSQVQSRYIITMTDLLSVKLKATKNIIPSPARNMPPLKMCNLLALNKAQLKEILSIKLKKCELPKPKTRFEPRHPVLRELLKTTHKLI